jgi:hypothetical protein
VSDAARAVASPEVVTISSTAGDGSQDQVEGPGLGDREASRKMHALCEYLAQWLLARDDDLEELGRWLRLVSRQADKWPAAAAALHQVIATVQQHYSRKYGVALAC